MNIPGSHPPPPQLCALQPISPFKMLPVGLIIASILAVSQAANPLFRDMVVHESATLPDGFVESGAPSSSKVLKLRIALTQTDIKSLEAELYAVSDPASARYGQHLSKEEVSTVQSNSPRISLIMTSLVG